MTTNISIEQNQLKEMVKEVILELFSDNREEFIDFFTKAKMIDNDQKIDLEESANLYAEIYQESQDLQQLTESALWD